jgi:hypothetical protein
VFRVLLAILFLVPSLGWAADGILPGQRFKVPFAVDGKAAVNRAVVSVDAKGVATLSITYMKAGDFADAAYTLTRQDVPPGPGPTPVPPDPIPPAPDPVVVPPLPYQGLHVLIVEERTDREKLTQGQRDILMSTGAGTVDEYVRQNCVKGPDGKTPQFRQVDQNIVFAKTDTVWVDARNRFTKLGVPVPGWIISNGVVGTSGPLPTTEAEALATLKKFTPPGGKK